MQQFKVLKDGVVRISGSGEVKSDGTVRVMGHPIVLRVACEAAGLDPKEVHKKAAPLECLARMGMNAGNVEVITEDEYDARQRAAVEEETRLLEENVPGLAELRELERQAFNEKERYHRQFKRMMDDEYNDGVRPPKPEDRSLATRLAAWQKAHPRAALYLKAERQARGTTSFSATSGEMKGGRDAMRILREGGTVEEAEKALRFRYDTDTWN